MAIVVRPIADTEVDAFVESISWHFGLTVKEDAADQLRTLIGLDRTYATFDDDNMVGTSAAYRMNMTIPGGSLPTAGLTEVGIAPTHRRRGLLTAMIQSHFDDADRCAEPLSALWASETSIYGRYGYGMAVPSCEISFNANLAKIGRPEHPDDLTFATADEVTSTLPALHEQIRTAQPGLFQRSMPMWDKRHIADLDYMRKGQSRRRTVIARRDGEAVGYATFRQKQQWTDTGIPDGYVHVGEVHGVDLVAQHSLWWFLSQIDLYPNVRAEFDRPNSIVPWLADNFRAVTQQLSDGLWLRVLDVARAMSSRRYDAPGQHRFEVVDERRETTAGTYELNIDTDGVGHCRRSNKRPSVQLSAAGLAALYLGGTRPSSIAAMGGINGDQEAIERLGRSMAWPIPPWCNESF